MSVPAHSAMVAHECQPAPLRCAWVDARTWRSRSSATSRSGHVKRYAHEANYRSQTDRTSFAQYHKLTKTRAIQTMLNSSACTAGDDDALWQNQWP
ncbi:hypothetical protein R69749_08200 [Paraburkholderia domus]|nr:hypothetical protein R69749_08200 [Paraburkholderia domus]